MQTIYEIMEEEKTDKGSYHHNYCRQYEETFSKHRNMEGNYLEIGVLEGKSLKAFRKIFKNARYIVGIDINPSCKQYEDPENGIFVEIGDSSNEQFLNMVNEKYGGFEVILDDGSHRNDDVITCFEILFPLLKNHGIYVAEDTNVYKVQHYINPLFPNHLDYFAKLTYFLNNIAHFDSIERPPHYCVDPFKIIKKTSNKLEQGIDKITFGCGFVQINKLVREHWI